jgi:hypothetical protein
MRYGSVVGGFLLKRLFHKKDITRLIEGNNNGYAEKSGRLMGQRVIFT